MHASRWSPRLSVLRTLVAGVVLGGGALVAVAEPAPPRRAAGFEAAVFGGAQNPTSDYLKPYDTGLRLGGLVGWRLSDRISLGAELSVDLLQPAPFTNNRFRPCGECAFEEADFHANGGSLSAIATVHYPFHRVELLLAGKVGLARLEEDALGGDVRMEASYRGYQVGLEAALAFEVGPIAVGPLLTMENQTFTTVCLTDDAGEVCRPSIDVRGDESGTIVAAALAVWY